MEYIVPNNNPKIAVAGLGYVGLSNAVLLAQHNQVTALDLMQEKVDLVNQRQSPIEDAEIGIIAILAECQDTFEGLCIKG
jgi:UDP-glucose 6-dehydrogenase